jgi:anti-sigma regulatory factor (Ser/Thr protein kinase)
VTAEIELAEAVLNLLVLRMTSFDVVCLYDSDTVGDTVLSGMRSSHPFLRGLDDNADYDPELATALYAGELPGAPEPVTILDVGPAELSEARHAVRAFAETRGLDEQRADDFVLAANEIMTNSIRHGGGRGRMSMWELEDSLVCQVADTGHITDPLIGRFSPLPSAGSGRGIWLANQVCDLVQVRSSPTGTVVRLFIDRSDGQR